MYARPRDEEDDRGAADARALTARVLRFIAAPAVAEFEAVALALHAHQYAANPPYRRYVDRLKAAPRHWTEIPAVPAVAFRDSVLACGPAARIYESSGTTLGADHRARHHVPDVSAYRAAALTGFARAVLPPDAHRRFVVAAPEARSHPASSLGEMVTWLRAAHDTGETPSFLAADGLNVAGFAAALDAVGGGPPVIVVAVTSALLRLVDHGRAIGRSWRLPTGSIVVDTGGCKGYGEDLPRAAVLARYSERLGVAPDDVINEYGMTELSSQLYGRGLEPLRPPPWLRVLVCDPVSGREQPVGAPGVLRFVDLANVGSVVGIQTDDVGRAADGGIELLGRAAGAAARGCSLLVGA